MAKSEPTEREEGAPVPRDAIDPELIKLARTRTKIGLVTSLGVVVTCVVFLLRLGPDRTFAGQGGEPEPHTAAEVVAGDVALDRWVAVAAEPLYGNAIRTVKNRGDLGARVVPARGTGDKLWLALPGDPWSDPATDHRYVGRLRELADVPFGAALREHAATTPRLVFAKVAAVRGALATGAVETITGDKLQVAAGARVAYDVEEPARAVLIASIGGKHADLAAWKAALDAARIPATALPATELDTALHQARFAVALSPVQVTQQLAAAELWAARVESVTTHHATTWGELGKAPDALANVDLVGIAAIQPIPDDAYVVVTGERPEAYWYVMPITIALGVIGLLFAWALIRAVRRDLLPPRA